MLNLWLHTEFIVKYWLVSRRIEQVLKQTGDQKHETYGKLMYILLFGAILLVQFLETAF